MNQIKDSIKSEWEVTDLEEPSKIIDIEITQTSDSVTISQSKYTENLLGKEGMAKANPVSMPLDLHIPLELNSEFQEPNRSNSFAKLLGELQYLANVTKPDISYAVNQLAAYTENPSMQHYAALKQILRYLAHTKTLRITYKVPRDEIQSENIFYGFADAAYANQEDFKSTTRYIFIASGGAITWKSKKQTIIALSTMESKYIALSESGKEAVWLWNLFQELGFTQPSPTIIKGDNYGSVELSHNAQFHQWSKHIDLCYHWIQELVDKHIIQIQTCRDSEQTADVLTKALPKPKHLQHGYEMGIWNI